MLHCSCTSFCGVCVFCFIECLPRNEIPWIYGYSVFNFWGTTKLFPQGAVPFYTPVRNVWGLQLLLFSFYLFLIIMTILVDVKLWFCSIVVLICIFLMPNDVEHLFIWSLGTCTSSLEKCLNPLPIFKLVLCVCVSFYSLVLRVIHIFWILYSYQIYDLQVFSPTLWEKNIHFLNNVLWNKKVFHFDEVQFIVIFWLAICAFEKPLPETRSQRFARIFPSYFYNFSSFV